MSDTVIRKMRVPPGAIDKELAALLRCMARRLGEGAIDRHLQDVAQHVVDRLRRLLAASSCRLHVVDALAGPGLQPLAVSPLGEIPDDPVGGAVTRSLRERRVVRAPDDGLVLAAPLGGDRPAGVIEVRRARGSWTRHDVRLVRLFADHAAVALEHSRRHAQAAEAVRVRERVRIANELHDTLGPLAFSIGLKLDWCLHRTVATSSVYPKLEEIRQDTGLMMAQIRQLIGHLSPEGLGETSFSNRLERLVGDFRELTGASVDLSVEGDPAGLPAEAADVLQKTLQEALVNIAKHTRARRVRMHIEIGNGSTSIEVTDDGVGFPARGPEVGGAAPGHFGLRQMHERIESVGGRLEIVGRPGTGVSIRGTFPLRPGEA
jgi:signal transduction histidine kinase